MSDISFATSDDNTAVVCIDGSFVVYTIIHSAVRDWKKESLDAENLPDMKAEPNASPIDVLVYQSFRDVLRKKLGDMMYNVRGVIRDNILGDVGVYDDVKTYFVLDSHSGNWRYDIYRQYKANRAKQVHAFDVRRVFDYIVNTKVAESASIFDDLGWKRIEVKGVEGDDIIATIMRETRASVKGIISSDHDYLQLGPKVRIFDIQGKEILPDEYDGKRITHKEAALMKVLIGDTSDNIPNVWKGIGPKKALKNYIIGKDKSILREALENDPIAKKRFEMNSNLILFSMIPDYVTESIRSELGRVDPELELVHG